MKKQIGILKKQEKFLKKLRDDIWCKKPTKNFRKS